jgi:hypothetical protein
MSLLILGTAATSAIVQGHQIPASALVTSLDKMEKRGRRMPVFYSHNLSMRIGEVLCWRMDRLGRIKAVMRIDDQTACLGIKGEALKGLSIGFWHWSGEARKGDYMVTDPIVPNEVFACHIGGDPACRLSKADWIAQS